MRRVPDTALLTVMTSRRRSGAAWAWLAVGNNGARVLPHPWPEGTAMERLRDQMRSPRRLEESQQKRDVVRDALPTQAHDLGNLLIR